MSKHSGPAEGVEATRVTRIELESDELKFGAPRRASNGLVRALHDQGVEVGVSSGDRGESRVPGRAAIVVRRRRPVDLSPAGDGAFLVQWLPWALGAIPEPWREALFRHAHEVWVESPVVGEALVEAGFNQERVFVVRGGVDTRVYTPDVPPSTLPTGKRFRFLFAGSADELGGLDLVIDAYRAEFTAEDDVALIVHPEPTTDADRAPIAGVDPTATADGDPAQAVVIESEGEIEPDLYTACDALIHPCRAGGLGLVVLEAMASGLPVVATRDLGAFELDEAHGFPIDARVVPVSEDTRRRLQVDGAGRWNEPELNALRRIMRALYENPAAARERAATARAWVERQWTWKQAATAVAERLTALSRERDRTLQALAHFMDGSQALEAGRPIDACQAFEAALSIEPCFPFALSEYAVALAQTGRLDGARQVLEQAMALAPDLEEVQENLALVRSLLAGERTGTDGR